MYDVLTMEILFFGVEIMSLFFLLISCAPKKNHFTSDDIDFMEDVEDMTEIDSSLLLDDLQRFQNWFVGEYSNHEQVVTKEFENKTKEGDEGKQTIPMVHHYFVPIIAPGLGDVVFYVQQENQRTGIPYRQRIYTIEINQEQQALEMKIYKFKDPALYTGQFVSNIWNDVTYDDLIATPGCEVYWRYDGNRFLGSMVQDLCQVESEQSGKTLIVNDDLILDENEIWIRDVGKDIEGNLVFGNPEEPHQHNRKLQYYRGWATIRPSGHNFDVQTDAKEWKSHFDIQIHSEGGEVELVDEEGEAIGYSIELAKLTRSSSGTKLLKLAIKDIQEDKVKSYIWTSQNASMIGMNLGWGQVGLTLEDQTPHMGFDTPSVDVVQKFMDYVEGHFDSGIQAKNDPDYYEIHLQMCSVEAPELGRHVLYVEQAIATSLEKPYRQRLYVVESIGDHKIRSNIYELHEPELYIGGCAAKQRPTFASKDVKEKVGCHVDMRFQNQTQKFIGKTEEGTCSSSLRGARFATSEVVISSSVLESWDRGYDEEGKQVWGAEKGAYQFRKQQ